MTQQTITVKRKPFFYDSSIKRYLVQVMSCFAGYRVKTGLQRDGEARWIDVPVVYGGRSRLAQFLENGGGLSTTLSLPILSVNMISLTQNANLRRDASHVSRIVYTAHETDHVYEGNQEVEGSPQEYIEERFMPVPYEMKITLHGMASNADQLFQITEQIGTVFNPEVDLLISNSPGDWASETRLIFEGDIDFDEMSFDIGAGTEEPRYMFRMNFSCNMQMAPPSIVYESDTIETIHVQLYEKNDPLDWTTMTNIDNIIIRTEPEG